MCTRTALEVREHLCAVSSLPLPLTGRTGDWSQVTGSAQQGLLPTEPHCQSSWIILLSIKPVLVHRKPGGLLFDLAPCSGLRVLAYLTFLISSVTFPCNKHVSALSEPVPIIPPAKLFLKFILILCPGLFFCPAWLKLESSGKSKSQLRKLAELRKWLHRIDCRQVEGIFLVNGCCG